MLVNHNLMDELIKDAGPDREIKARKYVAQGRVKIDKVNYENNNNFEISADVSGNDLYRTYIQVINGEIEDISCDCPDYFNHYSVCKHTLATLFEFLKENDEEIYDKSNRIDNYNEDYVENEDIFNENERIGIVNKKAAELLQNVLTSKKDISNINPSTRNDARYRNFRQIASKFYQEEIDEIEDNDIDSSFNINKGKVIIEPKFMYDRFVNELKVEFKIGIKRMYKLKSLSEFYDRMLSHEKYKYGDKLEFIHTKESFSEDSQKLLEFLLKYAEIVKYANSNANSNYRYYGKALSETSVLLGNSGLDEIFEILNGREFPFQNVYGEEKIKFIKENPDIYFIMKKIDDNEYEIIPNIDLFKIHILRGKDYQYILLDNILYRCSEKFTNSAMRLIKIFRQNYLTELYLQKEDLFQFFSVVMPRVKNAIHFQNIDEQELERYKPEELQVKVFLDYDENDYLVADVKFIYGENEFNPLNEKQKLDFPRNMVLEAKSLNLFRKTGFMFDVKNLRFILPDNDKIYEFLTNDISIYMQKFDVMVTDNFKTKEISKPKMGSLGVKIENDLLSIDMKNINIDMKELQDIMSKYKLKKRYHRLKDGSFIDLEDNKEVEFLDQLMTGMDLDYKDMEKGEIKLPVHRSLYLNQILKGIKGTEILKDDEYRTIVRGLDKENIDQEVLIPKTLNADLRYYQKTGFKWLKVLDSYRFGGVLADDMGLGKTIQLLAIILDDKERSNIEDKYEMNGSSDNKNVSIVICPSSLTLNWYNEAQKFAPTLKVQVIHGNASERKRQINNLEENDLIITSYDLLKRDIDIYKEKNFIFRFAIADEAQYLKNSNTQNAKTIKQINAKTRFALTGTPIENSLAELWSIFDFIMPGYLFTYKKFKSMYELPIIKENDELSLKQLKMLIEPFVLRRTKKEVLTELPEKTITLLDNEMEEEQRNIYLTYLAQAKEEIAEKIEDNSFEKNKIKILALLTRLRQVCCHPKLFLENYTGRSSKLDQCVEIIQEAVASKHKILLFSTYTSMFPIIGEELKQRGIPYFELTGKTKVEDRIKMVDEFNESDKIQVFFISLKAGGTGLNLTGADMVIHYDPWWNLSAENQATDRAYRIGQKNNVQVYKLITKNSIEEKIYELQEKKAKLAEDCLNTNVTFINQLSRDDIMNLFS